MTQPIEEVAAVVCVIIAVATVAWAAITLAKLAGWGETKGCISATSQMTHPFGPPLPPRNASLRQHDEWKKKWNIWLANNKS